MDISSPYLRLGRTKASALTLPKERITEDAQCEIEIRIIIVMASKAFREKQTLLTTKHIRGLYTKYWNLFLGKQTMRR